MKEPPFTYKQTNRHLSKRNKLEHTITKATRRVRSHGRTNGRTNGWTDLQSNLRKSLFAHEQLPFYNWRDLTRAEDLTLIVRVPT